MSNPAGPKRTLADLLEPEAFFRPGKLPCPLCLKLIGTGGMKGWLIRRLGLHFQKCRPRWTVERLRR